MTDRPETPENLDPSNEPPDDEARVEEVSYVPRRRYAHRVLLSALFLIVTGILLHLFWPWLLPTFIFEGPLVQQAGENEVSFVWYLTHPVNDEINIELESEPPRVIPVEQSGTRCRAKIAGLEADHVYPYLIRMDNRQLGKAVFRTNRRAGQPFMFLVFGDSGKGSPEQYLLAERMARFDPDFILHTGDLIYNHGERFRYRERFFRPYAAFLGRVNFWPSIGNHDITEPIDQSAYFEIFDLPTNGPADLSPEHEYWFDYADARIVILDSERPEETLRDQVAPWLRSVLQDAPGNWKFVVFHRPPYTAGRYEPNAVLQRTIVPVLEETGVDVVFNGHDHMYERTYPIRAGRRAASGPVYVVTGAGGAALYEPLPPEKRPDYIAALHAETHSFTLVRAAGCELLIEQIALDGTCLDRWTLQKASPARP